MSAPQRPRVLCLPTGPDDYAFALAAALDRVAEVELVAPVAWMDRLGGDLPPGVRVTTCPWPRHRDPRSLALVTTILRRVRLFRPDVLHFLGDSVVWLAFALPLLRATPLVVTVHDVEYHPGDVQSRRVPMATVRRLRRAADALIVHGEGLRAALRASLPEPRGGIHVVPHLVLDRYARLAAAHVRSGSAPSGGRRVLFFGRIMAYKGLGLLIDAADLVVRRLPQTRFIVAGTGPDLDRWRTAIAARPWFELRERRVPDLEAAELFAAADVVVLPYREASQSGVAAVAAAFGLPVVATDVGDLGELVAATEMGQAVPVDAMALADALVATLADPQVHAALSAAARRAAAGPLSPARVAALTAGVYVAAMGARRPAAVSAGAAARRADRRAGAGS